MDPIVMFLRALALIVRSLLGGQIFWPCVVFIGCIAYAEVLSLCRTYLVGVVVHSVEVGYGGLRGFLRGYCAGLAKASVDHVAQYFSWTFCRWRVWLVLFRRRQRVRRFVSKRVDKVIRHLDFEGDDTVERLVAGGSYVRAAVLYSRQCRLALRYPKHSAANEMIVVDWLNKHLPEDMPFSVKFKIVPLATKLTFVKSERELRADEYFGLLGSLVDSA